MLTSIDVNWAFVFISLILGKVYFYCSYVFLGYFFFVKRVNFSANFSSYTKTAELTQTRPQGFSVSMPFSVVILHQ